MHQSDEQEVYNGAFVLCNVLGWFLHLNRVWSVRFLWSEPPVGEVQAG